MTQLVRKAHEIASDALMQKGSVLAICDAPSGSGSIGNADKRSRPQHRQRMTNKILSSSNKDGSSDFASFEQPRTQA